MGTLLVNLLLGTKMYDMTSVYQGFHEKIVREFDDYPFAIFIVRNSSL